MNSTIPTNKDENSSNTDDNSSSKPNSFVMPVGDSFQPIQEPSGQIYSLPCGGEPPSFSPDCIPQSLNPQAQYNVSVQQGPVHLVIDLSMKLQKKPLS